LNIQLFSQNVKSIFGFELLVIMSSRYAYDPSLAVATVVAILFAGVFIGTALQTLRYKSWVWLFMVLGVAMEAGGYIARAASTKDVTNGNLYVVQFLLVFLAPVFMAAACYIVFVSEVPWPTCELS
jgi:hypothetical protein